jgi:ubiquinone/menaquinone biosynthesis C-methylase UbiE
MPTPGDPAVPGRYLCIMAFAVSADSYDRFMGRYSSQLAAQMADLGGVVAGQRVLDVGCGPGALTGELVARGAEVTAVDPSQQFVAAVRERYPGVDAQVSTAEDLPFGDTTFDATLAQLVVHFMSEPVRGLAEMARVARPGGAVAACVWDHAGERTPLGPFWQAAREIVPGIEDEGMLAGARPGHLTELFEQAGLEDVEETSLTVRGEHATFEDWWEPFTLGVGPAGAAYQALPPEKQRALEARCRELLPAPITLETRAWAARGVARRPQG